VKTTPVQPVAKETAVVKTEKPIEKAPEIKKEPTVDVKKIEKELAVVKQELAKKIEVENKKKRVFA
jgi:hypothetical protein